MLNPAPVKTPDPDIEIATKKLNLYGLVSSPGSPVDHYSYSTSGGNGK